VGQKGIAWLLRELDTLESKADTQFGKILDAWNHAAFLLALAGGVVGAGAGIGLGPGAIFTGVLGAAVGGALLAGEIQEIGALKANFDSMIATLKSQLQDIADVMVDDHTAITVATVVNLASVPAQDDVEGEFQLATNPWEGQSIQVVDVTTWK
jgi:hypothetical protein